MRRSFISIVVGGSLGFMLLAAAFVLFSMAQPGWLRSIFVAGPTRVPPATAVASNTNSGNLPTPIIAVSPLAPLGERTATPAPSTNLCVGPAQLTIALLGVDDRGQGYEQAARTDAISLLNARFTDASAALFSIPRDLYVALPNLEEANITQDRINTAYVYGEVYGVEGGGPAEVKATVELNFGIRVERYVLINFSAFEAAVDALGGIDINVPEAIYDPQFPTDDEAGGTIVLEIPAGWQHMDGRTALRYARTRHQDDDYHRVQRQQLVLLAIRDKLLTPEVIPQLPALLSRLGGLARTDLTPTEIAQLMCLGPQIDRAAIATYAIDGTMVIPWTTPGGGRVSIPNREVIAPLVQGFLGQ